MSGISRNEEKEIPVGTSYEAVKKFMDKEKLDRRKYAERGDGYIDIR